MLRERDARELPQPRRRDLFAGWIDRCKIGRRPRSADVVALDVEAVPAQLAAQPQMRAGRELLREPRLVEPGSTDRAARVAHARSHDRPAAGEPPCAHVDHLAGDRDLVVAPQLRDGDLVDRPLVTAWPVQEQVADGLDPERAQSLRERGADARQRRDRERTDDLGRRPPARPAPLVLDHTCETRVHSGQGCHRNGA